MTAPFSTVKLGNKKKRGWGSKGAKVLRGQEGLEREGVERQSYNIEI